MRLHRQIGSGETTDRDRSVRSLRIVVFTHWNGSASLHELLASISELSAVRTMNPDVVMRDIDLLARGGFPISRGPTNRIQIRGTPAGSRLRLTRPEASLFRAWCATHCLVSDSEGDDAATSALRNALMVLDIGIRRFCTQSGLISDRLGQGPRSLDDDGGEPVRPVRMDVLRGESRRLHRRLHIVDLIDSRMAVDIEQLAEVCDASKRTVHTDLVLLRSAGFDVRFGRRLRAYTIAGLGQFLEANLSPPMADALRRRLERLVACEPDSLASDVRTASQKLAELLRVIQRGRITTGPTGIAAVHDSAVQSNVPV